jgi:glycosyltransferase involved in cell wall biosynthesis
MLQLSIVIPVYYGLFTTEPLIRAIKESMLYMGLEEYEIILVDDGSPDDSWAKITEFARQDNRIKGLLLSRNFGQHYAISAGLRYAGGEWVVVMDCDLQDDPDEIPNLYTKAQEGWDIVFAQRLERKDNYSKKMSSRLFYTIFSYLSGIKMDGTVSNFGIYNNRVIAEYNQMPEHARSFGSLLTHLGFKRTYVPVVHQARNTGKSTYNLTKLLRLAGDIIISNSNRPLKLAVVTGFLISIVSFSLAVYNVLAYFRGMIRVPGFTTTIFSIWFVGGLLLLMMGILGLYIGKIFDQVKGRQLFVVSEKINLK